MIDIHSHAELMALVDYTKPRPYYALETWFNQPDFVSEHDKILLDEVYDDASIAPFVLPTLNGVPMKSGGYTTKELSVAYTKFYHALTVANLNERQPGEPINEPGNRLTRLERLRIKRLGQHRAAINTLREWMAWQFVLFGKYTITGDNYPTRIIDFGRDANNTRVLVGGAQWVNPTTCDPMADIELMCQQVLSKAELSASLVTMDTVAWNKFRAADRVKDRYKIFQSDGGPNPNVSPATAKVISRKGSSGDFEIEVVNTKYTNAAGVETAYLPANTVIVSPRGSQELGGVTAYGRIHNLKAIKEGVGAVNVFHSEWTPPDGSAHYIQSEAAPLTFAKRVNAFGVITP